MEVDIVRVEEPEEASVEQSDLDAPVSYVGKKSGSLEQKLMHCLNG